jgi:hypothetical protein
MKSSHASQASLNFEESFEKKYLEKEKIEESLIVF